MLNACLSDLRDLDSFNNTKYFCGVFYHKLKEISHWKATITFFPENKQQVSLIKNKAAVVVNSNYVFVQNVNTIYKKTEVTGPTAEFEFKRGYNPSVKIGFKVLTKEWNVKNCSEHNKVYNNT